MKTLILTLEKVESIQKKCWMVEELGEREEEIKKMFGTNKLPTPFLEPMSAEEVKDRIKKLNPLYEVRVVNEILISRQKRSAQKRKERDPKAFIKMGLLGGYARTEKNSKEKLREFALKAAATRREKNPLAFHAMGKKGALGRHNKSRVEASAIARKAAATRLAKDPDSYKKMGKLGAAKRYDK